MSELKKVEYEGSCSKGEVAYVILENGTCVFTYSRLVAGLEGVKRAISTINALEEIVQAICEKEGVSPRDLTFHDLQTCRGYKKELNQFVFDKIIFGKNGPSWVQVPCPSEIVKIFREFIGPNPQQVDNTGASFQG